MNSNVDTAHRTLDIPTPGGDGVGSTVTEPVKQQAQVVSEELRELGHRTKEAAQLELEAVRQRGEQYLAEGKDKVDDWERSLTRSVHESPMKSLAIAAGAGLLLGFIARR